MSILDNMVQHFHEQEMRKIEVPEWGSEEEPLVIYSKPFTLKEQKKLHSLAKEDNIELLVYTLILKALDENGEKMFTLGDKATLMMKVDPNVIARVITAISSTEDIEDHLGN